MRRWYNPPWYSEQIPSTPYDPIVLRNAFEEVKVIPCHYMELWILLAISIN